MQNMLATEHISFILVFLEGLLSFFSPCVLPLIPIYISYLAGGAEKNASGETVYRRGRVMLHTVFFILGISFAFFLLGLSFSALGQFFSGHKMLFSRIGGILIVLLGLMQIGFFELKFLQKERKFHLNLSGMTVNPVVAFVMGFTFSFAWTPCVGPALSSVLILASGAKDAFIGNLLVLVYALGFVLPFLALGLFTTQALNFFKRNGNLLKYTIKAGGILLIVMGVMTFTGWMNGITGYLNSFGAPTVPNTSSSSEAAASKASSADEPAPSAPETPQSDIASSDTASGDTDGKEPEIIPAFDFTLKDQYGNEHTLSDYRGKVVFLNFWATWCPPCQGEMPHIEDLYNEYGKNEGDVIILGVANPKTEISPWNQDVSTGEVKTFLSDNSYTFPTVMDETGEVFSDYFISSFPTTFMIDRDGNIYGYLPGAMTRDIMVSIIEQTQAAA